MIVIGHPYFEGNPLYRIKSADDVSKTPSNSTVLITFSDKNIETLKFLSANSVSTAVEVNSITEVILSENYGVAYILVPDQLAEEIQKIADNYLFDSKILATIESDEELEKFARIGVDGVIFKEGGICTI